mmetsp:Transcript_20650/g.34067  ORF Transcript_20650/g.34067 Transcript_20650/m.34067 type:complete len:259 (+) Transcript_20650:64-840(+)
MDSANTENTETSTNGEGQRGIDLAVEPILKRALEVDCGGHILGNFPKYYEFNPSGERLEQIPTSALENMVSKSRDGQVSILDVGCNDGTLTDHFRRELVHRGGAKVVTALGIEIDPKLVKQGNEMFKECRFKTVDIIADSDDEWNSGQTFDVVSCFGVTMWVHLNYGDEGLIKLLGKLCKYATTSVILEPQTWKNYTKAKKRLRRSNLEVPMRMQTTGKIAVGELIDKTMMTYFEEKIVHGVTRWGRSVIEYTSRKDQ